MSITEDGIDGETRARKYLNHKGIFDIQQFDWFVKIKDKYFIIEVKVKDLFFPPPFLGTGLEVKQIERRRQIFYDLGIDTILVIFEKGTNKVYYNYLSKLEETEYFDTKNNIRIYNIKNFKIDVFELD